MSFIYPLGLIALVGVPILIIIYIIKNKYTEQIIASTYIWTLSEKFLKKRLPIHRLVGLISLILQILIVICIALSSAQPVFVLREAANDFCFVLDGSGSMNIVQNGKTRLDSAKDEISSVIKSSKEGSSYSLVFVGNTTDVIFDGVEDKDYALKLLSDISPAYAATGFTDAIGAAQGYFNENPSVLTYLVTDKHVEAGNNVEVINVSDFAENYAVSDVEYAPSADGYTVRGNVISYESATELTVELYVDGGGQPYATKTVSVEKAEKSPFSFGLNNVKFMSLKVRIVENDALSLDNEVTLYNVERENEFEAYIISDTPFFIQLAFSSVNNSNITVIDPKKYDMELAAAGGGFGGGDKSVVYVFENYTPRTLPTDGAIWFFNPDKSVENSGFTVQYSYDDLPQARRLSYTDDTSSLVETLLANINRGQEGGQSNEGVYVSGYRQCGTYRKFTTLMSLDGNPMIFTGTNSYGNREVVFAFDIHCSNLPLLADFNILSNNLLKFTFPSVIDNASYFCGETVEINVPANCDSIRMETPQGKVSYLDTSSATSEYGLTEVGTYSIKLLSGTVERVFNVYCSMPEAERSPASGEASFSLTGEASAERRDGVFKDLLYLYILLAVVFIADWAVYCYEQYQLR